MWRELLSLTSYKKYLLLAFSDEMPDADGLIRIDAFIC